MVRRLETEAEEVHCNWVWVALLEFSDYNLYGKERRMFWFGRVVISNFEGFLVQCIWYLVIQLSPTKSIPSSCAL